jgi:8-oxo-dGTP pyrophosphatase MutT (NUDIX family)
MTSPDPEVARWLRALEPLSSERVAWLGGTLPLQIRAYGTLVTLPDALLTSIRCVVRVGETIVLCENRDGLSHVLPGGRREPGESHVETAIREVHEETGWKLDRDSLRPLGWIHLQRLGPCPPAHPGVAPEFVQLVFQATASSRDLQVDGAWSDTEGHETHSELTSLDDALRRCTGRELPSQAFLRLIAQQGTA